MNIKELERKIIEASTAYYGSGGITMSDRQFDTLVEELRKQNPLHWLLSTPDWGYKDKTAKPKIRHIGKEKVGSIDLKIKYPSINLNCMTNTLVSPKLDGLSVVITFFGGEVLKVIAATRGDGEYGVEVTEKIKYLLPAFALESIRQRKGIFSVRGEIIVPVELEKELREKKDVPHTRNFAAGVMGRIEVDDDINYLAYLPYYIRYDNSKDYKNQVEMIEELTFLGFNVPETSLFKSDDKTALVIPETLKKLYERWKTRYPIDGLVLSKITDFDTKVDYTVSESDKVAYKFDGEQAEVVVDYIDWSIGSQGRLCPRIILTSPILLSGAYIQSISGHNVSYIEASGIDKGAIITIIRSNDVIPYCTGVIKKADKINLPVRCQDCDSKLIKKGVDLLCPNRQCTNIAMSSIVKLIDIVGSPEGLAYTTLKKWLDNFPHKSGPIKITTLSEFVTAFLERSKDQRGAKLQAIAGDHYGELLEQLESRIERKLNEKLSFGEFWMICNFQGLSTQNSKKMAGIDPRLLTTNKIDIELASRRLPSNVVTSVKENYEVIIELSRLIPMKDVIVENKESKFKIVITGKMSMPRKQFVALLESKGIEELGSVTKETRYLVCNAESSSSKYLAAKKLGVEIVTEEKFEEILNV